MPLPLAVPDMPLHAVADMPPLAVPDRARRVMRAPQGLVAQGLVAQGLVAQSLVA